MIEARPAMETVTTLTRPDGRTVDLSALPPYQRITVDMVDTAPEFVPIYLETVPFTMTSVQNMFAMYNAIRFIAEVGVPGDVVECGVWRGGMCMIAALTLQSWEGHTGRKIWLYDTFSGMSLPTEADKPIGVGRAVIKQSPISMWHESRVDDHRTNWCFASLEDVRQNIAHTEYPADATVYVEGKVEQTIPGQVPNAISCLRLDTDWYESSYHELTHLYPLLSTGGVLILDDYGFWEGQKKAVDQYFEENGIKLLMHRIDANARIAIKTG
jgi:O-methyltransferase